MKKKHDAQEKNKRANGNFEECAVLKSALRYTFKGACIYAGKKILEWVCSVVL
ncbi:MAG: hypothetical protein GY748_25985 [Planctomycetaceae bacterium]|nr:hypothetical protein [Planctomycetaceae bacterium]